MTMCKLLILFLVHWGKPGIFGEDTVSKAPEGGNITVGCPFNLGGSKKIFCRNDCNERLVETSENSGHKGRYSIKYEDKTFPESDVMYVSITNVTRSDSGQYQCVLERFMSPDGSYTFRIEVTNDLTSLNPTYTLTSAEPPLDLNEETTANFLSITELQSSTVSPKITRSSQNQKYTTTTQSTSTSGGTLLYVGVTLAVILILLTAVLVIFCWNKRTNKPKEPPVSTEYAQIPEDNRVYEEIPEHNRQSGRGSVEISTVYSSASYSKPPEDQIYSLAAPPSNQQQVENSSSITYSEVDFSDQLVNSAPDRQTETVLYSIPQVQTEDSHYSTVSLPQQ